MTAAKMEEVVQDPYWKWDPNVETRTTWSWGTLLAAHALILHHDGAVEWRPMAQVFKPLTQNHRAIELKS